ncbi:MAG: CcmD family protein [Actinomycetota bacterium]
MRSLVFLGVAYAMVWAGIVAYLVSLARRQRVLERRIEQLRTERAEARRQD